MNSVVQRKQHVYIVLHLVFLIFILKVYALACHLHNLKVSSRLALPSPSPLSPIFLDSRLRFYSRVHVVVPGVLSLLLYLLGVHMRIVMSRHWVVTSILTK